MSVKIKDTVQGGGGGRKNKKIRFIKMKMIKSEKS